MLQLGMFRTGAGVGQRGAVGPGIDAVAGAGVGWISKIGGMESCPSL
ncbi:MAG: hypothetical protein QM758_03320 [Armatimonas sp.]